MNIELLREVIARCMSIDPNDDFGIEKCWEEGLGAGVGPFGQRRIFRSRL